MDFDAKGLVNESESNLRLEKSFETFFGKKDKKKDLGTDQFLSDLYAYPPKFSVYSEIERKDHSDVDHLSPIFINDIFYSFSSLDKFASSPHNRFPGLSALRPLLLSEPKTSQELSREIVPKYSYSMRDYFKGYLNRNFTSHFYKNITKPLKKALETTTVYVVLNGQEEIILAHETNFGDPTIPNNKFYDICGAFADNGTLKKGKLGLVFFGYDDAKNFMDAILELEPEESSIVGLAVHCVRLDSVYDLMRSNHPGTDFRLVPNLKHLVSSFSIVKDSRFLFQDELYEPKLDSMGQDGESGLSDLSGSSLQNTTKGVPVYLVQLQENRQSLVKRGFRSIANKADSVGAFLVRPHRLGRKIMKGTLPDNPSTNTYLFFDYKEALDFCKKFDPFVVRLSGSYLGPKFDRVVQKPIIFATNLETLLEQWENDLLEVSNNKNLGPDKSEIGDRWRTLKIVPPSDPWDKEESKLLNSPLRKTLRETYVRYKILKSFLEFIWLA